MRGQKLFVRPMEITDSTSVRRFLDAESPGAATPATALLGKLLGDIVALVEMEITYDSVLIHHLVVARDLRRKRVARMMLNELASLAAKMDREWLVFGCSAPAEFLKRVGFDSEGRRMVRRVG